MKGAGGFLAGAAVNGLYTGLKFTGLAVRVASGLAASISKDAEAAMAKSRAARQEENEITEQVSNRLPSLHVYEPVAADLSMSVCHHVRRPSRMLGVMLNPSVNADGAQKGCGISAHPACQHGVYGDAARGPRPPSLGAEHMA